MDVRQQRQDRQGNLVKPSAGTTMPKKSLYAARYVPQTAHFVELNRVIDHCMQADLDNYYSHLISEMLEHSDFAEESKQQAFGMLRTLYILNLIDLEENSRLLGEIVAAETGQEA